MFITYKITCTITGKYYIGSHKTDNIDDGYMGSGKLIRESIKEYGVENHIKEIIDIFDNREDSLKLEHALIKERRTIEKDMCLNASYGGECSDFLGEELHKEALLKYELNPKYCLNCGKLLSYDKRYNIFCNNRCSAIYNNKLRCGYKQKKLYCKQCGKEISMPNNSKRQFCSISCATTYRHVNSPITEKRKLILDNLDIIKERHITESYRQIATDYGVSGQFIRYSTSKTRDFSRVIQKL